jgi:hypothetical protein
MQIACISQQTKSLAGKIFSVLPEYNKMCRAARKGRAKSQEK